MPREDWVTEPPQFLNHFRGYVGSANWTDNIGPQAELVFTVTEIIDPPDLTTPSSSCWYSVGKKGEWAITPDGKMIAAVREGKKIAQGSKYGMLVDAIKALDSPEHPMPILDLDPKDMDSWMFQGFEMMREEMAIPAAFLQQPEEEGKTRRDTTSFMRPVAYLGRWDGAQFIQDATGVAPTAAASASILEQVPPETIEQLVALAKGKNDSMLRIAAKQKTELGTPQIMDALINKNLMQELIDIGAISKGADGKYQ